MAPLRPSKDLQAFIDGCEQLISAVRAGAVLSKYECDIVEFYLSELLTILKNL